jgi:hypothetical protein
VEDKFKSSKVMSGRATVRWASKRSAVVGERSVEYFEFIKVPSLASGD